MKSAAWESRLDRALGITRVAHVQGLDRVGVAVACAVRPGGHVLQVSNGKGLTPDHAARSARREAAELACAERVHPGRLVWSTAEERARWDPTAQVLAPSEWARGAAWGASLACAFVPGQELLSRRRAWVPAWAVHCIPPGGPVLGVAQAPWTSNGMGAHERPLRALTHALFEAVERDQLARALPRGWTPRALRQRIPDTALPPLLAAWRARLEKRGLSLHLFDLTLSVGEGALAVPLAAALLFDREGGPMPLAAGYASRERLEAACLSAFLEAAQSRLTDIHGAREDVAPVEPGPVEAFREACEVAARRVGPLAPGAWARRVTLRALLQRLAPAGFTRLFAVELAPAELGLSVVKVVVPGFLRSELL